MVIRLNALSEIRLNPEHGTMHVGTGHVVLLLQQMVAMR